MTREVTKNRYLSGHDVVALVFDDEILDAIEASLRARGKGETLLEPRRHLRPDQPVDGIFNVLRGYIVPDNAAGVEIAGDIHERIYESVSPGRQLHKAVNVPRYA